MAKCSKGLVCNGEATWQWTCVHTQRMDADQAKEMLKVKQPISNTEATFDNVDALFDSISINQWMFESAYQATTHKQSVILKRNTTDVWVNQYNQDLLRCWDANMDIQFVCDAYACVVYIIFYISKAEREMGLLLKHAENEVKTQ